MTQDEEMGKRLLRWAKIIQIICLGVVLLFIGILYMGFIGTSPVHDPVLTLVLTPVGAVVAIIFFTMALKAKGWWLKEEPEREFGLFKGYAARAVLLLAVAGYGLILGLMGAGWHIILPFFIIPAVSLILTFPTQARWK